MRRHQMDFIPERQCKNYVTLTVNFFVDLYIRNPSTAEPRSVTLVVHLDLPDRAGVTRFAMLAPHLNVMQDRMSGTMTRSQRVDGQLTGSTDAINDFFSL